MTLVFLIVAQFSPGDLARAHEKSEGLTHCTDCHKAQKQLGPEACFSCHTELSKRVQAHAGYHGRMASAALDKCQSCHREHQGKDAKLVDWGPAGERGFDHGKAGFALHGKHASLQCGACHDGKFMDEAGRALAAKWKHSKTFTGLDATCTGCHADEHRGQLGTVCQNCHNESAWRPAPGFDHAKSGFELTGKHKSVACTKCHAREPTAVALRFAPVAQDVMRFKPVAHEKCATCHEDPHRNQFGARCENCHSTASWHAIKSLANERAFHEKTRYPLRGAHVFVECKECHGPFGKAPAKFKDLRFDKCMACHNDAHHGQLKEPACERCHTLTSFTPANFELEDHTSFALLGAHRTAPCNGCHLSEPKAAQQKQDAHARPQLHASIVLKPKVDTKRCESCHADPHGKQFSKTCASCHRIDSFHALSFDHAKNTRFALTGAHARTECASCHTADEKGIVRFARVATTCESCHADKHGGQFGQLTVDGATLPARACGDCHETHQFKDAKFDHGKARFTLGGKHTAIACDACHKSVSVGTTSVVRYRPLPQKCQNCHADPHNGAFKGFEP